MEVAGHNMQENLEQFFNNLKGEVISIIPNAKQTFRLMGNATKIDHLLIVEKRDYAI